MKIRKTMILFIVISVLFTFTIESKADRQNNNLRMKINQILNNYVQNKKLPGITVYIKDTENGDLYFSAGKTDLKNNIKIKNNYQFRIGSITKSFTAASILKLHENNKIDIDDPISKYCNLNYNKFEKITVRNLLNMSSGLGDYLEETDIIFEQIKENPTKNFNPQYLIITGCNIYKQLKFEPGTKFDYSNTNYIILGKIIENVSSLSYENYVKKHFIDKYNLNNTILTEKTNISKNLAKGYWDSNNDDKLEEWTEVNSDYVWSAGKIISTAKDVAKWLDLYASGKLFNDNTNKIIFQGTKIAKNVFYSTGLSVNSGKRIGHNGTVIGYHSDVWYHPQLDITVSVLSNVSGGKDYTRELVNKTFEILTK